jgi:capsular exopolysaccharide synthesis family protein
MKQLQEAVLSLKLLKEDYTDIHPLVKKADRKIEQLKSVISNTVENSYKNIEKRKALLSQAIEKQEKILNTLPANERTYSQLERQFKMNNELHSYLLQQKAEQEMIKASTVSKNRILDSALLPTTHIRPKRVMMILIGTLLGFVISIVVILLKVFLDTKIKSLDDIKSRIDYPIIGSIPHISELKEEKNKIKVFESPKSVISEAFRNMRTNIHFLAQEKESKVILVSSTVGEEGKTTVSINLGAIMSLAKKKTILVNLDMRKPTLHHKFDLPNITGMSELLVGANTLDEVIQKTKYENLDIISSGPIPPNPSELIHTQTMIGILDELKERYDVIILDTPPVGLVADAKGLMMFTDVNLFVIRNRYSKKEYLDNFDHLVVDSNIEHIGVVYNDVKFDGDGYGYTGSYGYAGYGYYDEEIK